MIFPECDEVDEEDDDLKNDIPDALRDLGELGFVVGYLGSQSFCLALLYTPLMALGIKYDQLNNGMSTATLVVVMLWVLSTKMRDYLRAVKRRDNIIYAGNTQPSDACVQIV
jgi:hypothetical protein